MVVRGIVVRASVVVVAVVIPGIVVPVVGPVVVVVSGVRSALVLIVVAAVAVGVAVAIVGIRVAIVVFFLGRVKLLVEASGGEERANGLGLDVLFQDLLVGDDFVEGFVVFGTRSRDCTRHRFGDGLVVEAGRLVVADEPSEGVHDSYT